MLGVAPFNGGADIARRTIGDPVAGGGQGIENFVGAAIIFFFGRKDGSPSSGTDAVAALGTEEDRIDGSVAEADTLHAGICSASRPIGFDTTIKWVGLAALGQNAIMSAFCATLRVTNSTFKPLASLMRSSAFAVSRTHNHPRSQVRRSA